MSTSNSVYEIRNGEGIIPVGTKKVVADAFRDCQDLLSVKIPEGVTSIGSCAFRGCRRLASVEIPNSVTVIDREAFSNCKSLTELSLPSTLESIDFWAFEDCESLTRVELPKSLKSINWAAFGSARIDELVLPFSTPSDELIVSLAQASIRKIVIPNGSLNAYVRAIKNSDHLSDTKKRLCNALVEEGGLTLKAIEERRRAEEREEREAYRRKEAKKDRIKSIIEKIIVGAIALWFITGVLWACFFQ